MFNIYGRHKLFWEKILSVLKTLQLFRDLLSLFLLLVVVRYFINRTCNSELSPTDSNLKRLKHTSSKYFEAVDIIKLIINCLVNRFNVYIELYLISHWWLFKKLTTLVD